MPTAAQVLHGVLEYLDVRAMDGRVFLLGRRLDTHACEYHYELSRLDASGRVGATTRLDKPTRALIDSPVSGDLILIDSDGLLLMDGRTLSPKRRWFPPRPIGHVAVDPRDGSVLVGLLSPTSRIRIAERSPDLEEPSPGHTLVRLNDEWKPTAIETPPFADFAVSRDGALALTTPARNEGGVRNELLWNRDGTWQHVPTGLRWQGRPSFSPDGRSLAFVGTTASMPTADFPLLRTSVILPSGERVTGARLAMVYPMGKADPGLLWSEDQEVVFRHARDGNIGISCLERLLVDGERQVLGFCITAEGLVWLENTATESLAVRWATKDGVPLRSVALNPMLDDWLESIPRRRREFVSRHGTTIRGELLGATPAEKRPLLVSLHGGPHGFLGPGVAPTHFYRWLMASRGWLVLALDPSGSGTYSDDHTLRIRGRWAELDFDEVLDSIDTLIGEGLVDEHAVSLSGFSYGGYLAAHLFLRTSRFRTATIGAPLLNLREWYSESDIGPSYLRWHFDAEAQGFWERLQTASVELPAAPQVPAPVLLLNGLEDQRCPHGATQRFLTAIEERGGQASWIGYRHEGHNLPSSGQLSARLDYHERVVNWLVAHQDRAAHE